MPSVSAKNVNHALTASVIEGFADRSDFVGLSVAPARPQDSISGNYPVIRLGKGEMLRSNMEPRKPGSKFKQIEAEIDKEDNTLVGAGIDVVVPLEIAEDSSISGLEALTVYGEEAYLNALRYHESRVAAMAQGSDFDAVAATVAYTQANIDTIDFPQDLENAIRRIRGRGERPDTITLSPDVWSRIRRAKLTKDFIVGEIRPTAQVTPGNLQLAFADLGIKHVRIAEGYVNNSAKGKEDKIESVWSNSHIWVGSAGDATPANPSGGANRIRSAMATFFWSHFGNPFVIKQWYDEDIESYKIRAWGIDNVKAVNTKAGVRITTSFA